MKAPLDDSTPNREVEIKSYEILVRQNHRRLLAYALSLTRQKWVAEDLVQDAFVVAFRRIAEFDPARDFGAWVRGIVRMKYLEWARARQEIALDDHIMAALEEEHAGWDRAVQDGRKDALDALASCLGKLAEAGRQVIHMFYTDRKPCAVIADILKASEESVRKRLQRAREELAQCVRRQVGMAADETDT